MTGLHLCFDLGSRYPVRYRVEIRPAGDGVKVEARFDYGCLAHPGHDPVPSLTSYIGPHPSVEYVDPPNRLMRAFGQTFEGRIESAKASVTRWAERTLAKEQRAVKTAMVMRFGAPV